MLVSQKLAIAAHMHVLLRRKTGRVTDTEWMAENLEYALEVVRFARAKATEDSHPDLHEWADKLERAVLDKTAAPAKPLVQSAVQAMRVRTAAVPAPAAPPSERTGSFAASIFGASSGFSDSTLDPEREARRDPNVPRYVGGIR
ncbi:hypothetical protein [Caenimonas sedimenti]|uniref:hypothetical protein n=1 Tax=Caenimonas sedimenti TaxID=2596921 RepID=UPI0032C3E7FF